MNRQRSGKTELRREFLARRSVLSPQRVLSDSEAATARLLDDARLAKARCVLLYLPVKNEPDTRDLFTALAARGTALLLPRCRDGQDGELDLYRVEALAQVKPGRFGILEPDPGVCIPAAETPPGAAIVPGVAFDRRGFRLGFGGGYYDRLFAREDMARTLRIGLAYDFQVVETLPADPWDRPMHALCTPKELTWMTP